MGRITKTVILGLCSVICVFLTEAKPPSNVTEISAEPETMHTNITLNNSTKHKQFLECTRWLLYADEFVQFPNGTVYVGIYNKTFNSSFYEFEGDMLAICELTADTPEAKDDNTVDKYPPSLAYLTHLGLGISMVCLLLHLIAFVLVPDLRNLPGYNMASLCATLFLGYLFLMLAGIDNLELHKVPCLLVASLAHFFLLASFLWTSVMALDFFKSLLNATGKLRLGSTNFNTAKFILYSVYAWGTPLLFVALALIADQSEIFPESYKPMFGNDMCWFKQRKALLVFFAAPVFVVICSNVIIFALSAFTIFSNRMKSANDPQKSLLKRNFKMYSRLAVIMGLTWVTGVIASIVNAIWLWYVFVVLNTLQGLFIFLAFTCASKVRNHFKIMLQLDERRASSQTLSPTFQSYCSYTNSIDKDLNAVVEIEKSKPDCH